MGHLKDAHRIRRLSYWVPILFIPVQGFPLLLFDILSGSDILYGAFVTFVMFAPFVVVFGYGYVIVVNLMYVTYCAMSRSDGE